MLIDEKRLDELLPSPLVTIRESIENMMIFGTAAIEVTPDGIKLLNINDLYSNQQDNLKESEHKKWRKDWYRV